MDESVDNSPDKQGYSLSGGCSVSAISHSFQLNLWLVFKDESMSDVWKLLLGLGLLSVVMLSEFGVDYLLARSGITKSVRTGLWLSAVFGPGITVLALEKWGDQITQGAATTLGGMAVVLIFVTVYFLAKVSGRLSETILPWRSE